MFLNSGAIAPSSLFSHDTLSDSNAFNKTYANTSLKIGIIKETITANSPASVSRKYPEYNVIVYEQNTNSGGTPTIYKNCPASQGFGSIADFFEYTLRSQETIFEGGNGIDAINQDGAVVLLLCINGYGDRGVIIATLNHPNRETTLEADKTSLQGEFNGVNISVADDGSCILTFKGATDSFGKPIDTSQGITTISIETDGSVQIQNSGVTQRLEKAGNYSVSNTGDYNSASKGNINISGNNGGVSLTSNSDDLIAATKGDLTINAQGDTVIKSNNRTLTLQSSYSLQAQQITLQAQALAGIKAPQITLDGLCLLGGVGGLPLLTFASQMLGVNAAGPVMSTAISGFTTNTFAV